MNAIMPRSSIDIRDPDLPRRWEGLAEFDQAVSQNRVMKYHVGRAWADPWGRRLTVTVLSVISLGFGFLAGAAFGFW